MNPDSPLAAAPPAVSELGRPFARRKLVWLVFLGAPYFVWISRRINLDLWNDEINSLVAYTFTPLLATAFRYENTNNHIFFNLLNHLLLFPDRFAFGFEVGALLRHPWMIRLVPLAYAIVTFATLYLIAERFLDIESAPAIILLLAASIPFYNFSVQIRGYGLSMMLLSLLIYFTWSELTPKNLAGTMICAAFLIYTLPTNALFIAALGAANALAPGSRNSRTDYFKSLGLLAVGSAVGFLGYLPPLLCNMPKTGNSVIEHFQQKWKVDPHAFTELGAGACRAFVGNQWLLPAVVALAVVMAVVRRSGAVRRLRRIFARLAVAVFMPFGIAYLFGVGSEFDSRLFSVAVPFFVLFFAAAFAVVYKGMPFLKRAPRVLVVALFVYFNACVYLDFQLMDARAQADIAAGASSQNLFQNFYLARYHISDVAKQMKELSRRDSTPIFLYKEFGWETETYLETHRVPFVKKKIFPELAAALDRLPRAYVFTIDPNAFATDVIHKLPQRRLTRLSSGRDRHNVFLLERRDGGAVPQTTDGADGVNKR